jgi:rubrerythrin
VSDDEMSRSDFLGNLMMGLLFEEQAILDSYEEWMDKVEEEEVRQWLSDQVEEAAHHKGEILDIIEEVEADTLPPLKTGGDSP